jgi:hypothetical protein
MGEIVDMMKMKMKMKRNNIQNVELLLGMGEFDVLEVDNGLRADLLGGQKRTEGGKQ